MEMDLPWDQPVPEDMIDKVVEYCVNDVLTTEATSSIDRKQDFVARQILAELSGLTVNDTDGRSTLRKIIFGNDRNPQDEVRLHRPRGEFPGYKYSFGKSLIYRGERSRRRRLRLRRAWHVSTTLRVLDVASMHPTSIVRSELFGEYTENFKDFSMLVSPSR